MKLQVSLMAVKANTFVPSWEDIQNIDKAESFNTFKATEDEKLQYLQIIAFLPFVADALLNFGTSNPGLLATFTVSTFNSMKESSEGNSKHENLDEVGHYIAGFFWLASLDHLPATLMSPETDGPSLLWAKELHLKKISPRSPTPASDSEIAPPSNATMTTLASNIAAMTNYNCPRDVSLLEASESKTDKFKN